MEVAAPQRGGWTGPQQRRVLFHAATASKTSPLPGSSSILPQPLNASTNVPAPAVAAVPSSKTSSSSSAQEAWFWSAAAQKIGAGLSNLGNTCFLNSVLQCLTYTPPLAGYLKSGQHQATCRAAGFCALCALQAHVKQALSSSGNVVSPSHLVKNLRSISKSFRNCRQEDAHEYMRYLIEAMHNCCIPVGVATNSSAVRDRSLVYSIFGGQLRSQVKCTVCSHCSNTYDPFLDLSLEIVRADSLTKALARFTAVESLDGNNKYYCSRCKKKVPALKQFTVDKAPNVLTIQFKRFSGTGSSGGKLDKKIEFGRTLDMQPFISNPQEKNAKYTLYAVLVHAGWSTHSGHYYCYVRTASGMWHALDDSRVCISFFLEVLLIAFMEVLLFPSCIFLPFDVFCHLGAAGETSE
jgi:ubiquitin carboxyl-terminal hydrolase 36/42